MLDVNTVRRYQIYVETPMRCLVFQGDYGCWCLHLDSLFGSVSTIKAQQQISLSLIFHYCLFCFIP